MGVRSIAKFIWQNPGNRGKRLQKFVRAFQWQVYKRTIRKPLTLTLANGVLFHAYPDCVISSALQYADWPEYAELEYCREHLKAGDIVIDVGANVGHFSLLVGDIVGPGNLYCFEPTPISWRRLAENFKLNRWPTDKLFQEAIGRATGRLNFPDLDSPDTTNSAVSAADSNNTVSVKVTPLDDLARILKKGSVGLVKVDVEGYEPEVFGGASEFLKNIRPRLVMFESLGGGLNKEVRDTLSSSGFRIFQLDRVSHDGARSFSTQNLFAAPVD